MELGRRTRTGIPSSWIGLKVLSVQRVGVDLPLAAALRGDDPAGYDAPGIRPHAICRNSARSGHDVGRWMRMRATCSITRAPIFMRRSRMVLNSAFASGFV